MANKISKKDIIAALKEDYTLFYKAMPKAWKEIIPVVTVDFLSECGLHFTTKHNGKMAGMDSISTTCKKNEICKSRIRAAFENLGIEWSDDPKKARQAVREYLKKNPLATNISICAFCFSDVQQDYMSSMVDPLARNNEILNNGIIHKDWIPVINVLFFRGESFGDFASVNAVINFFNFAKANKGVNFTAWTKNLVFFRRAIDAGNKKPANFKLVYSSQFINKKAIVPEWAAGFVNAVFTVYTPEFAAANNITINCGARACLACLRCYKGYKKGQIKEVNELLK